MMIELHGYAVTRIFYDACSAAKEEQQYKEQNQSESSGSVRILHNFADKEFENISNTEDEPKEDNSPSADNQKKEEDNSGGNETQPYQGEPVCSNEPTEKIKKGDACPTPDGDNSSEPPPVVFEIETLQPQNSEDYGKPECVDPKEEDAGTMPGNIPLPDTGPDKPIINGTIDPSENQEQTSGSGSDNFIFDPGCIDPAETDDINPVPTPSGVTGIIGGNNPSPTPLGNTVSDSLKINNNLIINDKLNTQVQIGK